MRQIHALIAWGFCFEEDSMSIFTLQPKDDPTAPTFNIEREHVTEFSRVMREHYISHGGNPKLIGRKIGGFFIEGKEAVKVLDDAGFNYGTKLDTNEKYWFAVFCARALRRLRGNPRHAPKFIEVF